MDVITDLTNLPQILLTWSVYFGAGALFLAVGLWSKRKSFSVRHFLAERFPFNFLSSRSVRLDAKMYAIGKVTSVVWGAPEGFLTVVLPLAVFGALQGSAPAPQHAAGVAFITAIGIVLFLTTELADFLSHYCAHKIPALWELHKVHHSADSLNPLMSLREHPLSIATAGTARALLFCIPAGAAMHFGGLSLVEVVAARALVMKTCSILTLDALRHSSFPISFGWLDRLFISPHMHQVHHSSRQPHWDRNFGTNLSLYDWLFRTGYKPVNDEQITLGIHGYDEARSAGFHTMYGAYVAPLGKAWSAIVRSTAGARDADGSSPSGNVRTRRAGVPT